MEHYGIINNEICCPFGDKREIYKKIQKPRPSLSEFYVWVSVHHKVIYIKRTNVMQLGSMLICNCNIALHVSDALCVHPQEHLETVVAASGE